MGAHKQQDTWGCVSLKHTTPGWHGRDSLLLQALSKEPCGIAEIGWTDFSLVRYLLLRVTWAEGTISAVHEVHVEMK